MTGLLKCNCNEYISDTREAIRVHERKNHSYGQASYQKVKHVPLTKEEKARIAAQGETRLGLQYFFGAETLINPSGSQPKLDATEVKYYHGPNESVK